MSYNQIMNTLRGTPSPTMKGNAVGPQLDYRSDEQKFVEWLRNLGIDEKALDPQTKLQFLNYWKAMQQQSNPNAFGPPPGYDGMRGQG